MWLVVVQFEIHRTSVVNSLWETVFMPKRNLRVVKWLSTTPAIGICEFCNRQFKVPLSALTKTSDAQTNMQQQFDAHKCKRLDASQNAVRVVREATEDQ